MARPERFFVVPAPLSAGPAIALALVLGTVCQLVARRFRIPVILLLLAAGLMVGHHVTGLVDPAVFGDGLRTLVALVIAVVVFEGTFHQNLTTLRRAWRPVGLLITFGAGLTALLAALAAHGILGLGWVPAWLFGAIVTVTGPTVIAPIVRRLGLSERLRITLEAESVLVDATGVLLVSVLLALTAPGGATGPWRGVELYLAGLATGAGLGLGLAYSFCRLLRSFPVEGRQIARLATLAVALAAATLSDLVVRGTAITAASVAGLACNAWMDGDLRDEGRAFMQDLVQIGLALVFVLVASGIDLGRVIALGWPGVAVVGLVMAFIRPLMVWICTAGAGYTLPERAFIAWMGPRGIVAAATSLAVSRELGLRGVPGGESVAPLVLMTIVFTVLVQGGLSGAVAGWLGLSGPGTLEKRVPAGQPGDGPDREAVA